MCGGREMQGGRPLHISIVHEEIKQQPNNFIKDYNPAKAPKIKSTDHKEIKWAAIVGSGLLICSPRRRPAGAGCEGVGLAIVSAIQAELDESEKATSLGSGIKCTAAGPLSSTSAAPDAQISRPIPISLQAQQINPLLAPLNSSIVSIKENKLAQKAAYKNKALKWTNHKSTPANKRINNNDEHKAARQSVFSTALSPPSNSLSLLSPDFLRACFLCKRPLGPGKDIYMYRGDRAFCTTECRYQQIVVDERKESCSSPACKGDQASAINKFNHRLRAAATVAAVG